MKEVQTSIQSRQGCTMENERLPLITKIMYGAGDLTNSLLLTIIGVYFAIFLTDVVRLDPVLAGAAIFVGRSMDWINDPIVGYLSDRTRSRWGRRRPFLLFGLAPLAIAFVLMYWVPPFNNQSILTLYYAVMYMFFDTVATFVYMPYFALTPELTLDYDERTSLSTVRAVFSIVGSILAFTLPSLIVNSFPNARLGHLAMALIFGTLGVLPLLLTFFGTRERPEYQTQAQPTIRESLAVIRNNQPFQFALGMYLLTWTTIDLLMAVLLYFIRYWLQMGEFESLIMGTLFVSAVIFLPVWNWLSHRWNKRTAYVVGIGFFALMMIVLSFVQSSTPLPYVIGLAVLLGVGVSAAHVIPWSILPDAVEWDEWQSGNRHEGAFYSMVSLAQKVASSIAIPLALVSLGLSAYIPETTQQAPSALGVIRWLVGLVPPVLLVGGIVFVLLYPLSRENHAEVRRMLAERRAQAAEASSH